MATMSKSRQTVIGIDSLRKVFDVPGGEEVAVDGINLEIGGDEFLSVLGPSGCGKTTTLRCIAGLETPTSGKIFYEGEDITDVPPHKRNIAMMFQDIALYPHMKIVDNIAYPLKVKGVSRDERNQEAHDAAKIMQIEELLEKYPGELSGGQQQRAALARTLVQDPQAFLMDEPLSDLDAKLKTEMRKEVQRIHKRVQKPTIYVTHDQSEAMTMSDRIAIMNHGQFEQIGTPDELYEAPANLFVASFIGNPSMNFVDAKVVDAQNGRWTLDVTGSSLEVDLPTSRRDLVGDTVKIGIRPEQLSLDSSDGHIASQIDIIERIGDQLLVTLNTDTGEWRVTVDSGTSLQEGDNVMIVLKPEATHLFDPETGENLAVEVSADQ